MVPPGLWAREGKGDSMAPQAHLGHRVQLGLEFRGDPASLERKLVAAIKLKEKWDYFFVIFLFITIFVCYKILFYFCLN
jgi:hypothetical protein